MRLVVDRSLTISSDSDKSGVFARSALIHTTHPLTLPLWHEYAEHEEQQRQLHQLNLPWKQKAYKGKVAFYEVAPRAHFTVSLQTFMDADYRPPGVVHGL